MTFSVVVPVKCAPAGRGDDLGRLRLLLASLDKFWSGTSQLSIHLICPRDDIAKIEPILQGRHPRLQVSLHDEVEVVPHLGRGTKAAGWLKQQAIKLSVHKVVAGDFALVLDADLFCTRSFDDGALFVNGRALTDWVDRGKFPRWWSYSAEVLRLPSPGAGPGMGVTPQLFSTAVCKALEEYLATIHGPNPYATLLDLDTIVADANGYNGWTEYTLYCLFAERFGLMAKYHLSQAEVAAAGKRLGSSASVWDKDALAAWLAKPLAIDPRSFFTVVQSNTLVAPEIVATHIREGLGLTDV